MLYLFKSSMLLFVNGHNALLFWGLMHQMFSIIAAVQMIWCLRRGACPSRASSEFCSSPLSAVKSCTHLHYTWSGETVMFSLSLISQAGDNKYRGSFMWCWSKQPMWAYWHRIHRRLLLLLLLISFFVLILCWFSYLTNAVTILICLASSVSTVYMTYLCYIPNVIYNTCTTVCLKRPCMLLLHVTHLYSE